MSLAAEHEALLCLCRRALGLGHEAVSLGPQQWERLFDEACRQGAAPLVAQALRAGDNCPDTTRLKFAALLVQARDAYDLRRRVLSALTRFFAQQGIGTLPLKGIALARLYPQPWLRPFSDLDLYHFGREHEAERLLRVRLGIGLDHRSAHHSKYCVEGVLVECHYDLIDHHSHIGNRQLDRQLKTAAVGPGTTFHALFLLCHASAHFAADCIALRHLVDWTLFCRHEGPEVDWPQVARVASRFGFLPFARGLEALCQQLLDHRPRLGADSRVARLILEDLFAPHPAAGPRGVLAFKAGRLWRHRWKHRLCYPAPWLLDVPFALWGKLLKPYTLTH